MNPTDADTEAGRGEGRDGARQPAEWTGEELAEQLEKLSYYRSEKRQRYLREAARRLRESDPGGEPDGWILECAACRETQVYDAEYEAPDGSCPTCGGRRPVTVTPFHAAPTDEAPEGTVHATISCENPECESRGQEPHKLYDGETLDYCQVCCEETLTLRLHTPPPVEEGECQGGSDNDETCNRGGDIDTLHDEAKRDVSRLMQTVEGLEAIRLTCHEGHTSTLRELRDGDDCSAPCCPRCGECSFTFEPSDALRTTPERRTLRCDNCGEKLDADGCGCSPPSEEGERGEGWWTCPTCERAGHSSTINPPPALYCWMCGTRRPEARQGEGDGDPRCEKCGSGDVSTRYEEETRFRRTYRCQETKEEHLHRTCRNCGYDWCDPVLTGLRSTPQGESDVN